jgi:2-keto-4-pentenoate hydratase/2-oxohepta-3-ene-1,7-dioic acid hydratase in catechol pathway
MRLATLKTASGPRVALQVADSFVDLSAAGPALPASVRGLLEAGPEALAAARRAADRISARLSADAVQFLPPVPDPAKIICLGLNYRDHAQETGRAIPAEPVLFAKYATTLIGHGDTIVLPKVSRRVDYEAELVVVVGRRGRHIAEADALSYVAGYTVGHDVSARDWQFKGEVKQWLPGKTFDTFAPTGPVLVTADEVPDPHALPIRLRLNGQLMQDSTTAQLIFNVPAIVSYLSQILTLEPGDLIFTGTPPGVGDARQPPVYLRDGDTVEVEIGGLGLLRNSVRQEA